MNSDEIYQKIANDIAEVINALKPDYLFKEEQSEYVKTKQVPKYSFDFSMNKLRITFNKSKKVETSRSINGEKKKYNKTVYYTTTYEYPLKFEDAKGEMQDIFFIFNGRVFDRILRLIRLNMGFESLTTFKLNELYHLLEYSNEEINSSFALYEFVTIMKFFNKIEIGMAYSRGYFSSNFYITDYVIAGDYVQLGFYFSNTKRVVEILESGNEKKPKKTVGDLICEDAYTSCYNCPLRGIACEGNLSNSIRERWVKSLKEYPQLEPMRKWVENELNKEVNE